MTQHMLEIVGVFCDDRWCPDQPNRDGALLESADDAAGGAFASDTLYRVFRSVRV